MKRINTIILPLLAAAALSSCSKQASTDSNFPQDRVIRVQASVQPSTKGSYDSSNLYEFAFYSLDFDANSYKYSKKCSRSPYSFEGYTPSWEWEGDAPLWKNSSDKVAMIAIAPVPDNFENYSYTTFDQMKGGSGYTFQIQPAQNSSDSGSDLIGWFKKGMTSDLLNSNKKVDITFQHLLSRLNLTFVLATEFNAIDIPTSDIVSDVVIKEASLDALVKVDSDLIAAAASNTAKADVSAYNTNWTSATSKEDRCRSQWECILVPETGANITISFNVNGKPYICTLSGKDLEQGKAHNLTINVGKDVATVGSMTIAAWEDGGSSNLETE